MKKISICLLTALTALVVAGTAKADSGIFGTGVVLSMDIAGSSSLSLFEMTLLGDSRFNPNSSGGGFSLGMPTLVNTGNSWATTTAAAGPNLGTFDTVNGGDKLVLKGAELLTWKGGGSNVSAADLFYSIDGGAFIDATLAFNQDNVNSNGGDQRWYSDTSPNANLLNGFTSGTHTLSVYFRDSNTDRGNDYISNNAHNFNATFTVVPEPSSILLILGSMGFGSFYLARRKRS